MARIPRFPGAPSERRSAAAIRRQRASVSTQIGLWLEKLRQPADAQLLHAAGVQELDKRRSGQPLPQFVEDRDALIVRDRVAVTTDELDAARAQLGPGREVAVPGLTGLRVLEGTTVTRRRRAGPSDSTPPVGAPIHLVPMGAIRKADGGPEMSGPEQGRQWTHPAGTPRGPRIAVIDTGITAEARADGWLAGLAGADNVDELDVLPPLGFLDLGAGHGTFVTGVIQQVCPDADIEMVRVLDTDGLGDEIAIGQQLVAAAQRGVAIVNLSLGTVTADDSPPLVLQTALREAIAAQPDILFVCAAGNYADDRPCWPAAFAGDPEFAGNVVSVAALRLDGDGEGFVGAEWSSFGPTVTCSVPGQGVVSTYVQGTETAQPAPLVADTFGADAWATWSGTSFATPQITGAIAAVMQGAGWTGNPAAALRAVLADGAPVLPGFGVSLDVLPV